MKRHPSLQPLSREHHRALLCWRKLDKAIQRPSDFDVTEILRELRQYWTSRFETHLRQEEAALLPKLIGPLQERMLREHTALRSMYENVESARPDIEPSVNSENILEFAELLRAHIRWEERTVFPWLQERLTNDELCGLFDGASVADATTGTDVCETSQNAHQ